MELVVWGCSGVVAVAGLHSIWVVGSGGAFGACVGPVIASRYGNGGGVLIYSVA